MDLTFLKLKLHQVSSSKALLSLEFRAMLLVIDDILETEFEVDTRSYYDNLGKFGSDKGKVGVKTHRVADNNFYQDYSYVIESESGIE